MRVWLARLHLTMAEKSLVGSCPVPFALRGLMPARLPRAILNTSIPFEGLCEVHQRGLPGWPCDEEEEGRGDWAEGRV